VLKEDEQAPPAARRDEQPIAQQASVLQQRPRRACQLSKESYMAWACCSSWIRQEQDRNCATAPSWVVFLTPRFALPDFAISLVSSCNACTISATCEHIGFVEALELPGKPSSLALDPNISLVLNPDTNNQSHPTRFNA